MSQQAKKILYQKISKCKEDPVYFLKNFAIIRHPMKGKIKFDLYPFQQQVLIALTKNRFVTIRKSRQIGLSTRLRGYIRWLMLFQKDKEISVICTKQKTALNMVRKVKLIYQLLPDWLKPNIVQDNKKTLVLGNGSRCGAERSTQNAGRSQSLSFLVLDEARFIQQIQQIWKAAYPTLSTGGSCCLLSTPNGINWFYKMHVAAKQKQNDFYAIQLPWWLHPDRGQQWKQKQIKNLGGQMHFKQQHQVDFQASGKSIVDLAVLSQIQREVKKNFSIIIKNIIVQGLYNKIIDRIAQQGLLIQRQTVQRFWIFELPKDDGFYAMTCDTSTGVGDDYSTFHVWDVMSYVQVRQFKGKVKPNMFAYFLRQVGRFYKNAFIAVERNKDGSAVNLKLEQLKYHNLFYSQKNRKDIFGLNTETRGLDTTSKSRPVMVAKMCQDVSKKYAVIRSTRVIQQLKTFVDKNGKPQRLQGYNDDLVMRLCIFRYLRNFIIMRKTDWRLVNRYSSSKDANIQQTSVQYNQQKRELGWLI